LDQSQQSIRLQQQVERQSELARDLLTKFKEVVAANANNQLAQSRTLTQLQADAGAAELRNSSLEQRLSTIAKYIEHVPEIADAQKQLSEWVRLLQVKMEMLAQETREIAEGHFAVVEEPKILDPEGYSRKITGMGQLVRLNLGCGERPLEGYLNIDARPMPGIDVLADARKLPFEPNSVHEIFSSHLVEHFRRHQLCRTVLPYWRGLLRNGGQLRIVCPNWDAMLQRLQSGTMSLEDFHTVTFGSQDYECDSHFAMYTPETLSRILVESGFNSVQILAVDRQNGLCPEMEVTAVVSEQHS
jgi:predicted SAM-dependent methyltransferase